MFDRVAQAVKNQLRTQLPIPPEVYTELFHAILSRIFRIDRHVVSGDYGEYGEWEYPLDVDYTGAFRYQVFLRRRVSS